MKWGFFSIIHIISIIFALVIYIILDNILKKIKYQNKIKVLLILSFSGIGAILYNLIKWESPVEYLPLHLCSLNALALPIAIISKNKYLGNLLLLWSLGAIFAIIINYDMKDVSILSFTFFVYYFPHIFEFIIPILLFKHKIIEKDKKCIISTIVITMIIYTIIHNINIIINEYCGKNSIVNPSGNIIQVNYMFSIFPTNPLLNIMYEIIPFSYWYMYLIIPIIVIYLLLIYIKEIKKKKMHYI